MSNIALIGEKEVIIGFSLVGLQIFPVNSTTEAIEALENCYKNKYDIVFITNEIAQGLINKIEEYQKKYTMTICILPNRTKDSTLSIDILRKNVEKAVGTDILFRKEG
ncbi:MAG: V-type ATP synthase subunit F [Candidatus Caldatribacteriota bacterium]|jgi:V/A-type H+-transporting ATPase subunit F|nr:V-type ATP synthase subunit F [Atribacterota bacterium]MDD3030996.1 V-type ATP synthase subunit F [Atribacterota bacterium]MDD3640752.1 V-type ATP synthase subunit F [Atribacterota bacterium]MDD4288876.1 V-type ATP synthase subunit F [Atribacterota bacterium]MDD4764262.1 V-type ATP synthase subunit F [Atribacterota bacterium]